MNELYFILYEPRTMYLDTSDMSLECERAHRRLCDFIWFSDAVPRNSDEALKQITHTKNNQWAQVKRELLQKGWFKSGGFFVHKGAVKSLNSSKEKYVENYNRQAKMNRKNPLKLSLPDSVTGIVTYGVTMDVTGIVKGGVTEVQSESESESEIHKDHKASAKRFTRRQAELTARLHNCLNGQWENDRQKWMSRISTLTDKAERVTAEVENAIKENRVKTTPAQFAEDTWEKFK